MNTTSLEKQKKGNLYVYKFGSGSKTPEYHPPSAAAVTKRIISSSIWGLRKSKSKPKNGKNQDNEMSNNMEDVGNATKVRDLVKGRFAGDLLDNNNNERKSVSSVEAILLSLANGKITEERKSNSHDNNNNNNSVNERKGQECIKGKILMEETRKSVSHVENNMAYVGKFMEKPRKSTGVKLETNLENCVALLQVKVLVTDMPGFMQVHAFQCARNTYDSLEKFSAKHLASNLKKKFDKIYGPAWHCIVGSSFGSFVTHATGCFLYFSMEKLCILLFRTKVARAVQK